MKFTVMGEPTGKGRARFSSGHNRPYTPKATSLYEELVAFTYLNEKSAMFEKNIPLKITITAYFGIPKSDTQKSKFKKLANDLLPTKKPDWDNIGKIISDALNGVAYNDDSQITDGTVLKRYSDVPRVEIEILEIGGEHNG